MPPRKLPLSTLPLSPQVYLILLALADGEAHGYRLRQGVIERSNGTVRLDPGSLYRLIARLFDEGLIDEAPGGTASDSDDARRRYYRLTVKGRRVLVAETERLGGLVVQARAAMKRTRTV